jgi:hypothetical protein
MTWQIKRNNLACVNRQRVQIKRRSTGKIGRNRKSRQGPQTRQLGQFLTQRTLADHSSEFDAASKVLLTQSGQAGRQMFFPESNEVIKVARATTEMTGCSGPGAVADGRAGLLARGSTGLTSGSSSQELKCGLLKPPQWRLFAIRLSPMGSGSLGSAPCRCISKICQSGCL